MHPRKVEEARFNYENSEMSPVSIILKCRACSGFDTAQIIVDFMKGVSQTEEEKICKSGGRHLCSLRCL